MTNCSWRNLQKFGWLKCNFVALRVRDLPPLCVHLVVDLRTRLRKLVERGEMQQFAYSYL